MDNMNKRNRLSIFFVLLRETFKITCPIAALIPKPPEGGFNTRKRLLKPLQGGHTGHGCIGSSYFGNFTQLRLAK